MGGIARRTRGGARFFLAVAGWLAASAACSGGGTAASGAVDPAGPDLPIAAGDATSTSVVLWARATVPGDVVFEIADDPGFANILATVTETAAAADVPVKILVTALRPGVRYHYRAADSAAVTGAGRFRTPAASGDRAGVRFGVSGDWRGELAPYPSIRNALDTDLDFFVQLGDTIYADSPSPALPLPQAETLDDFRRKHDEVYRRRFGLNTLGALRASTVVYAVIDDHEVTNDYAGGAPPGSDPRFPTTGLESFLNETALYGNGLQAFLEYNPLAEETWAGTEDPDDPGQADPRLEGKPKLYRYRRFGDDAAIFILDARSFRSEPVASLADPTSPDAADIDRFYQEAYAATDTAGRTRTMLGAQQLAELRADLMQAHAAGVTWKFVFTPEPTQNLGPIAAEDRFEGYARERDALLRWIADNSIRNVVFVAADIHGTIANNLTYQIPPAVGPGEPLFDVPGAWEITTGPVAYDAPFGPTVVDIAVDAGLIGSIEKLVYDALSMGAKDSFLKAELDAILAGDPAQGGFGYDPTGLPPALATLLTGDYVRVHAYGWTEFHVDAATRRLTVTTYGIEPYTESRLLSDPDAVTDREPRLLLRFAVDPMP